MMKKYWLSRGGPLHEGCEVGVTAFGCNKKAEKTTLKSMYFLEDFIFEVIDLSVIVNRFLDFSINPSLVTKRIWPQPLGLLLELAHRAQTF